MSNPFCIIFLENSVYCTISACGMPAALETDAKTGKLFGGRNKTSEAPRTIARNAFLGRARVRNSAVEEGRKQEEKIKEAGLDSPASVWYNKMLLYPCEEPSSPCSTAVYHGAEKKARGEKRKWTTQPGVRKNKAKPKLCKMTAIRLFSPESGEKSWENQPLSEEKAS